MRHAALKLEVRKVFAEAQELSRPRRRPVSVGIARAPKRRQLLTDLESRFLSALSCTPRIARAGRLLRLMSHHIRLLTEQCLRKGLITIEHSQVDGRHPLIATLTARARAYLRWPE